MDFFTVPTLTFGVLYCFFVIGHDRRKMLHFNVTRNPNALGLYRNCEKLGPTNSRTDSCFTRTGRISDSRTTRQQVGLLKFALRVKKRFNPSRDSAACTIVMRWQRRFKSCFSESQILL